jgi:UDP-glucose 4-epimerase
VKLLVTGGAGYIRSVVAHQLVEAGHETVVLDNLSKGYERTVPRGQSSSRATCSTRGGYAASLPGVSTAPSTSRRSRS